jgi:uncharacterized protein
MTPEERDLVNRLFQRLKSADAAQKDREAEDLINRLVVQQPAAPYLLTQTVLVQEHALNAAQARIAELEAELAGAKRGQPEGGGRTSFLGGLAVSGPWGARASAPASAAASQGTASSAPPVAAGSVPVTAPPAGGGFLRQALATAAGVAGGALLFDGIRSLFAHNPGPFGPALGAGWGQPMGSPTETTIVNNYYGTDDGHAASGADPSTSDSAGVADTGGTPDSGAQPDDQGGLQDADFNSDGGDFDGGGTDFGGGDDSSFT